MNKQTESVPVLDVRVYESCTKGKYLLLKSAVFVILRPFYAEQFRRWRQILKWLEDIQL